MGAETRLGATSRTFHPPFPVLVNGWSEMEAGPTAAHCHMQPWFFSSGRLLRLVFSGRRPPPLLDLRRQECSSIRHEENETTPIIPSSLTTKKGFQAMLRGGVVVVATPPFRVRYPVSSAPLLPDETRWDGVSLDDGPGCTSRTGCSLHTRGSGRFFFSMIRGTCRHCAKRQTPNDVQYQVFSA